MFGGDPFGGGDPFDDPFFTGGGSASRREGRGRDPFGGGGLLGQMMGGALGQQLAGLEQAFGGGGGSTGGAGITGINPSPGIRPGIQPGTNPGTIIPGLAPTGPPKPAGYKTEWSIGGGRFKIDEIYPGKTEAVIKQV